MRSQVSLLLVLLCSVFAWQQTGLYNSPIRVPRLLLRSPQVSGLQQAPNTDLKILPRIRPACPIRMGGIYTLGLGESNAPYEESARQHTPLSSDNVKWIPEHCDVIALNAVNIAQDTFRAMTTAQPLFTPLLYAYASSLYEQSDHAGNIGGWEQDLSNWTLKDVKGREVAYPESGGHWMDFGSVDWAHHWRDQAVHMVRRYGAQGVVAAELPVDNTFIEGRLKKYATKADRVAATAAWLEAAQDRGNYLLVPAGLGFDALVGHATQPLLPGVEEPQLSGRLWDEVYPVTDGAWVEGWVRPYWADAPLSEAGWERQLEAADRAGRNGQVFIAGAAYRNNAELEYALASYLLVTHRQGRFVFQPMPIIAGERRDAGFSLAVLRREMRDRARFFDVPLGLPEQPRHLVPTDKGNVWRRTFQLGVVYVNSTDHLNITVSLGAKMRRLDGSETSKVLLPPHSGVTLIYEELPPEE